MAHREFPHQGLYLTRAYQGTQSAKGAGTHQSLYRRTRRCAALLTTVLLAAAAASIVLVLVNVALTDLRSASVTSQVDQARSSAREALVSYQAELNQDPLYYYHQVDSHERARVCTTISGTQVIQPGNAWPTTCAPSWTYQNPVTTASARLEVTPPSASSPTLRVTSLAQNGSTEAGLDVKFTQRSTAEWTVSSDAALNVGNVERNGAGPSIDVSGASFYSGGTLTLPPSGFSSLTSVFASETTIASTPASDASNRYYTTAPTGIERNVRDLLPTPRRQASLRASAEALRQVSCTQTQTPVNLSGSPTHVSSLCLRRAAVVRTSADSTVTVPGSTTNYMLVTGGSATTPTVTVYTSSKTSQAPTDSSSSLPSASGPAVAAGTHPGAMAFWTLLGTFNIPASGVIGTDADTQLGVCTAFTDTSGSAACASLASSSTPGMAVTSPLTVVVGSSTAPKDVYVASPVTAAGGNLGVVSFGDVVVPYWARPPGSSLTLDVAITALGLGQAPYGVARASAVHVLPTVVNTSSGLANTAGRLTLHGSVAASTVDFSSSQSNQYSSVAVTPNTSLISSPPPHFSSYSTTYVASSALPAAPISLCGQASCEAYLGGAAAGTGDSDTTAPGSPTSVSPAPGGAQVTLTWAKSSEPDLDHYTVYYKRTAGTEEFSTTVLPPACPTSTCTTSITGLVNGASYTFALTASDTTGNESSRSASVSATPNAVPGSPLSPTVAVDNQAVSATVSWAAPASGTPDGYRVYRNSVLQAQTTSRFYTDTNLTTATNYTYTVTAYTSGGESPPATASPAPVQVNPAAPSAPAQATPTTPVPLPVAVSLSWASSVNASGYRVYRSTTTTFPGYSSMLAQTSSALTYTDATAASNTTYYYWVTAYNATGESAPSTPQSMKTGPAAPSGTPTVALTSASTNVTVTYSTSPSSPPDYQVVCTSSNGGTPVSSSFAASSAPVTLSLSAGYTYTCAARAAWTGDTAISPFSAASAAFTVPPTTPTMSPLDTTTVPGQITVSWSASQGATSYRVYRGTSLGTMTLLATVSTTSHNDSTVTPGVTYYYYTLASADAWAYQSGTPSAVSGVTYTLPGAPTSPAATSFENSQSTVTWTAPSNSGGALLDYQVCVYNSSGGTATGVTGTTCRNVGAPTVGLVFTGLTNGTAYTFKVTAYSPLGAGPQSSLTSPATPMPTVPTAPTSVVASSNANTQSYVNWTAPTTNGGASITDYQISVYNSSGGAATGVTGATVRNTGSGFIGYTFTGLTNGTAYTFKVAAINAAGTSSQSPPSASAIPATTPGAPTSLTTAQSSNTPGADASIAVSFTAPASNGGATITTYTATSSPGGLTGTAASSPVTVTGLTSGVAYTFTVTATNASGTGTASAASSSITPTLPTAPTINQVTPNGTSIFLQWDTPTSMTTANTDAYEVRRDGTLVATITATCAGFSGAPCPQYVDTGLTTGTSYSYTVTARKSATGFRSSESSAKVVAPSSYANRVINSSPAAYYRMDDYSSYLSGLKFYDSTTSSRGSSVLTATTGPNTNITSGLADGDKAVTYTQSSSHVSTGNSISSAPFNYPTSGTVTTWDASIEVWFKTTGGNSQPIIGMANSAPGGSPGTYVPVLYVDNTGVLRGSLGWHGSASTLVVGDAPVNDGNWHQVVITHNNRVEALYVDGLRTNQLVTNDTVGMSSGVTWYVGASPGNSNWTNWSTSTTVAWRYMAGSIDDLSIYNTPLSQGEVLQHYAEGRDGNVNAVTNNYRNAVQNDSPWTYYRNQESGTTANDSSSNSHTGAYSTATSPGQWGPLNMQVSNSALFFGSILIDPALATLNGTTNFTIEAWVRPAAWPGSGSYYTIFSAGDSVGTDHIIQFMVTSNGSLLFGFYGDDTTTAANLAPANVWTHVAVTYNGTSPKTAKIYVNGVVKKTTTGMGPYLGAAANTAPNWGQRFVYGAIGDQPFLGWVAEEALYRSSAAGNGDLSTADLLDHYNQR